MKNYDETCEKNFVGLVLSDSDVAADVKRFPKREWFRNDDLGKISEAVQRSCSIDPLEISQISGVDHLEIIKIQIDAPVSLNPNGYADMIFTNYKARKISSKASGWINATKHDEEFFKSVERDILDIQQISGGIHDVVFVQEALENWVQDKEERISGIIKPVMTGFPIDNLLAGGFHKGDLVTIAGRPGSGKSAFLKSSYLNMVKSHQAPKIAVFSVEMTPTEYLDRMFSEWAGINGTKVREAVDFDDSDLDKMMEFSKLFYDKPISFNRTQACDIFDIIRLSKAAKMKLKGLDLIFVDHLHIIKSHNSALAEKDRIPEITMGLKRLAQELEVPVVCAAQCNRESEKRTDKTPQMSDLRGSGSIEQDSNCVMFIHRPEIYDSEDSPGLAELALRKNRHGKCPALLNFRFNAELTSFQQLA